MADKRKYRVFKTERRDILFPMWRKKVDASIFYDKAILIPKFIEPLWGIPKHFKGVFTKGDQRSKIKIHLDGKLYNGNITDLDAKKRTGTYRVFYGEDLADRLKDCFIMSFMRDLEFKLGDYTDKYSRISIEDVIPFNEFLDIEFNIRKREMIFTAHYTQQAVFPYLFKKVKDTTILKSIDLGIKNKYDSIVKSKWHNKTDLLKHPDQKNVLYYLVDDVRKQLYVGEAKGLKNRLSAPRPEIPNWNHFRYNVLPALLEPYRIELERMIIRDLASLFPNAKKAIEIKKVSDYKLKNRKIDK